MKANSVRLAALVAALCWTQAWAPTRAASPALDLARQLNQAFTEVAARVSPAVVVIRVAHRPDYTGRDGDGNPLWDMLPPQWRRQFEERFQREDPRPRRRAPVFDGQGSGMIIREDGFILTNSHVVDGADKIKVRLRNGKEYDAQVRGVDPQSDIAVIKIDARDLPTVKMTNSDKVKVGEYAIAIGAPFDLEYSVTFGHVSAKGRSGVIPAYAGGASMDQDFIQTDASINRGNSGGPLVNIDGEVMGVNTLIRGEGTGIGFAVPSNLALSVAEKIIEDGKFTRAWLGLEIRALSEDAEYRELVRGTDTGVVVVGILRDGPAAKSELRPGDVITQVDGKQVATATDLRNEVRGKKLGADVTLDVVRMDKKLKIKVQPQEWPDDASPAVNRMRPAPAADVSSLGLTLKPLDRELAKQFDLEETEGVVVTAVEPGSPAQRRGIRPGDIVTEVNRKPVATLGDFRAAVKDADLKRGVILNLTSQGTSRFVVLKDDAE